MLSFSKNIIWLRCFLILDHETFPTKKRAATLSNLKIEYYHQHQEITDIKGSKEYL